MATSTNLRLKILDANSVSRIFTDHGIRRNGAYVLPLLVVIAFVKGSVVAHDVNRPKPSAAWSNSDE
jgi:hypothetical protein